MEFVRFTTIYQSWRDFQVIPVGVNCNGYIAVNKGDVLAFVNEFPIKGFPIGHPELSGESYGVFGNLGEIYTGKIELRFDNSAGTTPWVVIGLKYYV